jgi:hypothetical protein
MNANYVKQVEPDGSLRQWEEMRDLLWANGYQLVFWHRVAKEWKHIGRLRMENEQLKKELHRRWST